MLMYAFCSPGGHDYVSSGLIVRNICDYEIIR